jgi:hypothetical protein
VLCVHKPKAFLIGQDAFQSVEPRSLLSAWGDVDTGELAVRDHLNKVSLLPVVSIETGHISHRLRLSGLNPVRNLT